MAKLTLNAVVDGLKGIVVKCNLMFTELYTTGTETQTTLGSKIAAANEKNTPVNADMVGLMDSAGSNILTKLSWANIKATLKSYFDTVYCWLNYSFNDQTASYTLVLSDNGKKIRMDVAVTANTVIVPPNSSVAFPVGATIIVRQIGTGKTSIVAGDGVTINSVGGGLSLSQQYNEGILVKEGADLWSWIASVTIPIVATGEKALTVTSAGAQTNYDIASAPVSATPLGSANFSSGTATVTGVQGQWAYDANYYYFCVGTNTWIRLANTSSIYPLYLSRFDDSGGVPTTASLNTAYSSAQIGQRSWGTSQGLIYEKMDATTWVKISAITI